MGDGLLIDLCRPGIGHSRDLLLLHLTLLVCSDWSWQQSTGQAHTHSLSLCWSPLVTGHHSGLMGDGLLMDLGRPGIGHSRDLSLLHLTLQVRSGNRVLVRHTHTLSLCWSPLVATAGLMGDGLLMDLGRPGIGHSRDLSLLHPVCKCVLTGPGNRVLVRHTHTLLVTTGHWSPFWSNGGWAPHGPGQTWNWALQGPLTAASHSASVF